MPETLPWLPIQLLRSVQQSASSRPMSYKVFDRLKQSPVRIRRGIQSHCLTHGSPAPAIAFVRFHQLFEKLDMGSTKVPSDAEHKSTNLS